MTTTSLRDALAPRIAPVVLANITTRYPYHDARLFREGDTPADPTDAHPAFGNSFDWHSSVHSHWTALHVLAHLAARGQSTPVDGAIAAALAKNLTAANLQSEAAYLAAHPSYERPYGWAWALRLAAAAHALSIEETGSYREGLLVLAHPIAANALRWLQLMPGPVRHGVHGNTAFALGLMLDAAPALDATRLAAACRERALEWFAQDRAYPAHWERSAHDFLSPGLAQADLMRRVLAPSPFGEWWRAFLGEADDASPIFAVAEVPDVSDGQIVHLHGLNLSRAGMLARIAGALDAKPQRLLDHAHRLYEAGAREVAGLDYLSTHWLATFAWDAATALDEAITR